MVLLKSAERNDVNNILQLEQDIALGRGQSEANQVVIKRNPHKKSIKERK